MKNSILIIILISLSHPLLWAQCNKYEDKYLKNNSKSPVAWAFEIEEGASEMKLKVTIDVLEALEKGFGSSFSLNLLAKGYTLKKEQADGIKIQAIEEGYNIHLENFGYDKKLEKGTQIQRTISFQVKDSAEIYQLSLRGLFDSWIHIDNSCGCSLSYYHLFSKIVRDPKPQTLPLGLPKWFYERDSLSKRKEKVSIRCRGLH